MGCLSIAALPQHFVAAIHFNTPGLVRDSQCGTKFLLSSRIHIRQGGRTEIDLKQRKWTGSIKLKFVVRIYVRGLSAELLAEPISAL